MRSARPYLEAGVEWGPVVLSSVGMPGASLLSKFLSLIKRGEERSGIDSPEEFRSALSDAALNWSDRPVVIMVDELDRCSPDYAVEMLQVLEHIFSVDNVRFVLAINQSQLVHSIKTFYGDEFAAAAYLERFFDDTYMLPLSNRWSYIYSLTQGLEVKDGLVREVICQCIYRSDLSLREIDKAVARLRDLWERGISSEEARSLLYLWVIRTLAPVEYRGYLAGEITDKSLMDIALSNGDCAVLRGSKGIDAHEIEGSLVLLTSELRSLEPLTFLLPSIEDHYELGMWHKNNSEGSEPTDEVPPSYSKSVVGFYNHSLSPPIRFSGVNGEALLRYARLLERDVPLVKDDLD